jgi:hypothetical protein
VRNAFHSIRDGLGSVRLPNRVSACGHFPIGWSLLLRPSRSRVAAHKLHLSKGLVPSMASPMARPK